MKPADRPRTNRPFRLQHVNSKHYESARVSPISISRTPFADSRSTLQVVGGLLLGESTGSLQQVAERDGNGTIDVQDQRVLLGAGDRLDAEGIVEGRGGREVLLDIVDDEDDSQVRVGLGLDLVSDTGDELVGLSHRVDEFSRGHAGLETTGHLGGGTVKGTSKSVTDGQETGTERRDEVLAGTGGDDGVHGTRNGGTVVGGQLQDHLDELAGIVGQTTLEPQERDDSSETDLLLEDVRDPHSGVHELLTTLVRDGRDEGGGLSDHAELLSPLVVHGNVGRVTLFPRGDGTLRDELLVGRLQDGGQVLESVGNDETGSLHGGVLGVGGLEVRVGHRTGVTELNLGGEHLGAGTDGPGDDGLLDDALLDGVDDSVLFDTSDLSQEDEHLALGVLLVTEQVVDKGGTGVSVTSDGDTLVGTVGSERQDVVQLVGHSTGLGDVTDGSGSVELGSDNVVHHTAIDTIG
jgi:hypothetical protein